MAMASCSKSPTLDFDAVIEKHRQGYSKDYDLLTSRLNDPDIETGELLTYIRAIRKCVIYLDRQYEVLVGLLLKLNWATRESSFTKEYQAFLLNLVSAHTYYLRAGLRMLVKHFSQHLLPSSESSEKSDTVTIDDSLRQKHDLMFVNVHLVLKAITQIVPMTPKVLIPLLSELFPFYNRDVYVQECYVKNLLQITHYLPNMRQKIMEIVVERLLKFDVRSPRQEIEELQREEEEMEDEDIIFEMDDPSIQKEIVSKVDTSRLSHMDTTPMTHKEAHKLDVLMEVSFKYIHNSCYTEGELDWEATKLLYRELLQIFETLILPTHASCHVQFIMFYMCSLKQPICDGFLDYLWKKVQDPIAQPIYRQISVCYMGSLLSRGLFIPVSTVKACLELMCKWVHTYLDQTNESHYTDITHHGPFYAVVQAILYVFVFRNKDIFESKKGLKWSEKLNFQRIVTSRLNPLKVCLPVIVQTFASVARSHQLAFCDTIIERNNRQVLPAACTDGSLNNGGKLLDSYFPFDPYILHRSGKYILPLYREYQGPIEEDSNLDENEEDDFIKEEIVQPSSDKMFVGSLSKTPSDFMEYGISPGFKHFQDMT